MAEEKPALREWTICWSKDGEVGTVRQLGIVERDEDDEHFFDDVVERSAYLELREKLARYGSHFINCPYYDNNPCTCGLGDDNTLKNHSAHKLLGGWEAVNGENKK